MGVRLASAVGLGLSVLGPILCIIGAPALFNEITRIREELAQEMQLFNAQSNELWVDMMRLGAGNQRVRRQGYSGYGSLPHSNYVGNSRSSGGSSAVPSGLQKASGSTATTEKSTGAVGSQSIGSDSTSAFEIEGRCNCIDYLKEHKCPAGPKGPKGLRGVDGEDGKPGADGAPGTAADDVHGRMQSMDKCFHCPMGPQGPPGPMGRPGPRGMRGAKGQPGVPGRDGQPGFPGALGPQGKQGPPGDVGPLGFQGDDADVIIGRKGFKGQPGETGPIGDVGPPGIPGSIGAQGPVGDPGVSGSDGKNGADGDAGEAGSEGEPGKDATYCPCPSRSMAISQPQSPRSSQPYKRS